MSSPAGRGGARLRTVVAAFVLALIAGWFHFTTVADTDPGRIVHGDAVKYVFYAYNLRHHDTFSREQTLGREHATHAPQPDKLTLPGYPWFVSRFLGDGAPDRAFARRVARAQALLGITTTLLAFLVASKLLPTGWAFAVGVLTASQPHLATLDVNLLAEPLFMPLFLAATLAALHAIGPDGRAHHAALAGLLLGLASLVRPPLQLLPWCVLLATMLVARLRPWRRHAVAGLVLFCAVMLPWQLRNAQVERPPGEPDLLVQTLYHGAFPGFMYRDDPNTFGYPYRADPDAARHAANLSSTLDFIGAQVAATPMRHVQWYVVGKPLAFLSWNMVAGAGTIFVYEVARSPWLERPSFRAVRTTHYLLHWPLVALCLAGIALALLRPAWLSDDPWHRRSIVVVAAVLLYALVLHTIGLPLPRYALPFRPLVFALALTVLHAGWLRMRKRAA